ncbi:phage adaptor protein [Marinobacter sp. OP 3.4]|uniref:phage adaptor protein n=1 Tax=Marinobacter sp. OP 3.4 TaxID=3076501 RepID=UPI002E1BAADB
MTTAGTICNQAATTLFDDTHVRWALAELVGHLSGAQRDVVMLKPAAYTMNQAVQLAPGTVQSLPDGGVALVDIGGNMGADGNTPGRSVTQIDRTILESARPDWRASKASTTARHFIYDDRDPQRFEVWPPQPDPAGYVNLVYAATPPALVDENSQISLPDIYVTALYYLVLARAYEKSTGTQDFNKAQGYRQIASQMVTGRKVAKQELHPEQMAERAKR